MLSSTFKWSFTNENLGVLSPSLIHTWLLKWYTQMLESVMSGNIWEQKKWDKVQRSMESPQNFIILFCKLSFEARAYVTCKSGGGGCFPMHKLLRLFPLHSCVEYKRENEYLPLYMLSLILYCPHNTNGSNI